MRAFLRRFDYLSFAATCALVAVGTVAIWSAGNARAEAVFHSMWLDNLVTAAFGFVLYFLLAAVDYRRILDFFALPGYVVSIACLTAVLVVGTSVYGGRRWLWFFQPSEISKLFVISLSAWLFGRPAVPFLGMPTSGFRSFLLLALVVGVPTALILAEPDLGTALTLLPAVAVMALAAGVWRKGLLAIAAVAGVAALLVLGAVYEAERPGVSSERREQIMRFVPLKPHQTRRVKVFLFPEEDSRGAGYNLKQAKISIGSGGFSGKGIGRGETNHLKYLPQAISMNDFIFCVWAEETGFVGSVSLLALFAAVLLGGCRSAASSDDGRGRLLALGVATLIFAHVYVNIAMSIGLVPITGLPLPFVSSGRTFLVTAMCGLGLVQSVTIHREVQSA